MSYKQYEQGINAGGEILQQIYDFLQREKLENGRADKAKANDGKSLRARSHEEAVMQQKLLVEWAEKNHKVIYEPNDYFNEELGEQGIHGTEAKVWVDMDRNIVVKSITPNHYPNLKRLLDRIAIHNMAFPTTSLLLTGVGVSDIGISLVVEQPFVEDCGEIPTLHEIQTYMIDALGFALSKGKGINAEYTRDDYIVSDIRPENVIKQPNGSLVAIDCFAMFQPTLPYCHSLGGR